MRATGNPKQMLQDLVVIHPGSLGDVLLAVPAIRRIRAIYAQHRCLLISHEPVGRFLLECGLINEWISIASTGLGDLFHEERAEFGERPSWLRKCDIVVAWMKDDRQMIKANLKQMGVRQVHIKSPFDPEVTARHQSDRFNEAIGLGSGNNLTAEAPIHMPATLIQQGEVCLVRHGITRACPIVVIHPGSGSRLKCANPEILATVIEWLQRDGIQILLLEGPADRQSVENVLNGTNNPPPVVRNAELTTVAGILLHAHCYIGHDSGITHLSGLLGVPTLALYGPTDPSRWAPRGPHVVILQGMPCSCSSWEAVARCPEKSCLTIAPDEIFERCKTMISTERLSLQCIPCRPYLVSTRPVC